MRIVNGWALYEHPHFAGQRDTLIKRVEALKVKDPQGFTSGADTKLLAAILKLTDEIIPADPADRKYRQGETLGRSRKHWFRAKFGNGRYRLFFQFNSSARIIIYAWVNDAETLRTYGAKTDAYAVFKAMLGAGDPPDNWADLMVAVGAAGQPVSKAEKKDRKSKK